MDVNELVNLIANVGFPVAVTTYILIRLEKQIANLTISFNNLNTSIQSLTSYVKDKQ